MQKSRDKTNEISRSIRYEQQEIIIKLEVAIK